MVHGRASCSKTSYRQQLLAQRAMLVQSYNALLSNCVAVQVWELQGGIAAISLSRTVKFQTSPAQLHATNIAISVSQGRIVMEIGDACTCTSSSTFAVLWLVRTPDGAALDFMRRKGEEYEKKREKNATRTDVTVDIDIGLS